MIAHPHLPNDVIKDLEEITMILDEKVMVPDSDDNGIDLHRIIAVEGHQNDYVNETRSWTLTAASGMVYIGEVIGSQSPRVFIASVHHDPVMSHECVEVAEMILPDRYREELDPLGGEDCHVPGHEVISSLSQRNPHDLIWTYRSGDIINGQRLPGFMIPEGMIHDRSLYSAFSLSVLGDDKVRSSYLILGGRDVLDPLPGMVYDRALNAMVIPEDAVRIFKVSSRARLGMDTTYRKSLPVI